MRSGLSPLNEGAVISSQVMMLCSLRVADCFLPERYNYPRLIDTLLVQGKNLKAERAQSSNPGLASRHACYPLASAVEHVAKGKCQGSFLRKGNTV